MRTPATDEYLRELRSRLSWRADSGELIAEAEDHLLESVERWLASGCSLDTAELDALRCVRQRRGRQRCVHVRREGQDFSAVPDHQALRTGGYCSRSLLDRNHRSLVRLLLPPVELVGSVGVPRVAAGADSRGIDPCRCLWIRAANWASVSPGIDCRIGSCGIGTICHAYSARVRPDLADRLRPHLDNFGVVLPTYWHDPLRRIDSCDTCWLVVAHRAHAGCRPRRKCLSATLGRIYPYHVARRTVPVRNRPGQARPLPGHRVLSADNGGSDCVGSIRP